MFEPQPAPQGNTELSLPAIELEQKGEQIRQNIISALEPILKQIEPRVFGEMAEVVRQAAQNSECGFMEAWIGVDDISLIHGVSVFVVLCHPEIRYNEQRQDFASDLGIKLANQFLDIQYSEVHLGQYPYGGKEDSKANQAPMYPVLWRKIF